MMYAALRNVLHLVVLVLWTAGSVAWAEDRVPDDAKVVVAGTLAKAYGASIRIDNPDLIDGSGAGSPSEQFGYRLARDGNTLAVMSLARANEAMAGALFLFRRDNSGWHLEQQIDLAWPPAGGMALSGDVLAISEAKDIGGFTPWWRAIRVFRRSGTIWSEEALFSVPALPNDVWPEFGALKISGNVLAVGVPNADFGGNSSRGVVDLFENVGATWQHRHRLSYGLAGPTAAIGVSLAFDGTWLVAGAPGSIGGGSFDRGAVVVFERSGSSWPVRALLTNSSAVLGDQFGASVALQGGTILVGAPAADSSLGSDVGTTYSFVLQPGGWLPQGQIVPSDAVAGRRFGTSVDLDQNRALIDGYVFTRSSGAWTQAQKLRNTVTGVDLSADGAVVVDRLDRNYRGVIDVFQGGEAQLLTKDTSLALQAANGGASNDLFGHSVALLDEDRFLIGAPGDSLLDGYRHGSASIMKWHGDTLLSEQKLVASDGRAEDLFGWRVARSGDTIVVSAPYADRGSETDEGAVYVFIRSGQTWVQQARLSVPMTQRFGAAVAISGDVVVVGSPGDRFGDVNTGSAYVFRRNGTQWSAGAKLTHPQSTFVDLGMSVGIAGDDVFVASQGAGGFGEVLLFRRTNDAWHYVTRLQGPNKVAGDRFGWALSAENNQVAIGAYAQPGATTPPPGAVYLYTRQGSDWVLESSVGSDDIHQHVSGFGIGVHLAGDRLAVRASSGHVQAFERSAGGWSALTSATPAGVSTAASVAVNTRFFVYGNPLADAPSFGIDAGTMEILPNQYYVGAYVPDGGGIATTSPVAVLHGDQATLTFVPNPGRILVSAEGCGGTLAGMVFTTAPVTENCSVTYTTDIQRFSLTYVAGANGSISGSASQIVSYLGSGTAVTAEPANGYHFSRWSDGSTANPRTDGNIAAALQVTALFANDAPQISALASTPTSLYEYEPAVLSAAASDRESMALSYAFDCAGDGVYEIGPQPSGIAQCSWGGPSVYSARVRVADGPGASTVRTVSVHVSDSRPTVVATMPGTAVESLPMAIDALAALPSSAEQVAAFEVDCDHDGQDFDPWIVQSAATGLACTFERGGAHSVAVRARDGEFEYSGLVVASVDVTAVNDAPEFSPGRERYVAPDSGSVTFNSWVTDIRPGPLAAIDEVGQQVNLILTGNSNTALFSVQPSLSNDGSLSFVPAPGMQGAATLSYRACDDGPTGGLNMNCSTDAQSVVGVSTGSDLEVAIDNHASGVVDGAEVVYALVVANAGPNPVNGAHLTTSLSPTLVGAHWVCVQAASTANCPAPEGSSGLLASDVDLAVGDYLRFDVMASVDAQVGASVSASAVVSTPVGVASLVDGNDASTDTDPVVPVAIFQSDFESGVGMTLSTLGASEALR